MIFYCKKNIFKIIKTNTLIIWQNENSKKKKKRAVWEAKLQVVLPFNPGAGYDKGCFVTQLSQAKPKGVAI